MTDAAKPHRSGKPRRRRWWQSSLRGLFLLVTLCAVGLYIKGELEWQRKKGIAERWAELTVRPTPTETVRLGLLLTEFDAGTDQSTK